MQMPRHRFAWTLIACILASLHGSSAMAETTSALHKFSEMTPGDVSQAWRFMTLPRKNPTLFSIVPIDGVSVLKVESNNSYGTLISDSSIAPSQKLTLKWRWRVDKLVEGADLKERSGDDAAAKVCIFFAFDPAKLPLGERAKLSLAAASSSGQPVPAETLCYVWDNKLPVGAEIANAFTKRIRMIVLASGTEKTGQWIFESRNVSKDYLSAFADESARVPDIMGIGITADADNTHGQGLAYIGDIFLDE